MRYCTGLRCNHWGEVPKDYDERKHAMFCPIDKKFMGRVPGRSPVETAGYKESDKVIPYLEVEPDEEKR